VRSRLFTVKDGTLAVQSRSYAPATSVLGILNEVPPLRWLSENSHLYSAAMNTAWMLAKRAAAAVATEDLQVEYAVPSEELTDYKSELAARLLERIHAVAREAGARLIVVDIPVRRKWADDLDDRDAEGATEPVTSSVPEPLRSEFRLNSDLFIPSDEVLRDFHGILPLHRPHGHAHITEVTHALLGIAVARQILCVVRTEAYPISEAHHLMAPSTEGWCQ
jgi:hypothetical protein